MSLPHDALEQPSHSQTSDPSLSVFIMTACRKDFCRLGPQDTVSIDFEVAWHFCMICVAMIICETDPRSSVEAGGVFSNKADFHGHRHLEFLIWLLIGPIFQCAILELENNRIHCSLKTVGYCLSRLLTGYRPFKRPLLLLGHTILGNFSTEQNGHRIN